MNRLSHRFLPRPAQRFLLAALLSLPIAEACSNSDDAPATPITFNVQVTSLDGKAATEPVALRCDHQSGKALGTLAVAFAITTEPVNNFVLRPANACGASTRCGYARIQGLSASDEVLGSVDTAATAGVLELDAARLAEVAKVKVSLIRGLDLQPLLNPDQTPVEAVVSPSFVAPSDCVDDAGAGGAGSGGAGSGGAGAGAGGESPTPPVAGAGGQPSTPGGAAGASLGGAAGDTSAGGVGGV